MAILLDRTPASHPRCQAESLPPPSPPIRIPPTGEPAGRRAGPAAILLDRNDAAMRALAS